MNQQQQHVLYQLYARVLVFQLIYTNARVGSIQFLDRYKIVFSFSKFYIHKLALGNGNRGFRNGGTR